MACISSIKARPPPRLSTWNMIAASSPACRSNAGNPPVPAKETLIKLSNGNQLSLVTGPSPITLAIVRPQSYMSSAGRSQPFPRRPSLPASIKAFPNSSSNDVVGVSPLFALTSSAMFQISARNLSNPALLITSSTVGATVSSRNVGR